MREKNRLNSLTDYDYENVTNGHKGVDDLGPGLIWELLRGSRLCARKRCEVVQSWARQNRPPRESKEVVDVLCERVRVWREKHAPVVTAHVHSVPR
jgi:hypothetical protein